MRIKLVKLPRVCKTDVPDAAEADKIALKARSYYKIIKFKSAKLKICCTSEPGQGLLCHNFKFSVASNNEKNIQFIFVHFCPFLSNFVHYLDKIEFGLVK